MFPLSTAPLAGRWVSISRARSSAVSRALRSLRSKSSSCFRRSLWESISRFAVVRASTRERIWLDEFSGFVGEFKGDLDRCASVLLRGCWGTDSDIPVTSGFSGNGCCGGGAGGCEKGDAICIWVWGGTLLGRGSVAAGIAADGFDGPWPVSSVLKKSPVRWSSWDCCFACLSSVWITH
jgi:hypothetical protein